MKTITLILASVSALFLSSCTCTKSGGSCCGSGTEMSCCKDAAAKGTKCAKCAAVKSKKA